MSLNNLENLHEGFSNEKDELESLLQNLETIVLKAKRPKVKNQLENIISNLEGLCDSLYYEFENSNESEVEEHKQQNEILRYLLGARIDHDDKVYIKLKYGIELD